MRVRAVVVVAAAVLAGSAGCSLFLNTDELTAHSSAADAAFADTAVPDVVAPPDDAAGDADAAGETKNARYRAAVLADAPVAYYRFAEASGTTAADERGTYAGTYVGDVLLGQEGPYPGSTAVRLGTGKHVDIGSILAHSAWPGLTLEGWFLTDADGLEFLIAFHKTSGDNVVFLVRHTGGIADYSDPNTKASSQTVLAVGSWYHVVASVDASNAGKLFVNGVLEATFTSTIRPATIGRASIGVDYDPLADGGVATNDFIPGRVAEVAIYDKALPDERVTAHYAITRD
jgi:hypothetical protein